MLVLTRKVGQGIMIADSIVVQVLEVNGRRIRLGVEAPPEVKVLRQELSAAAETHPTRKSAPRKPQ
jgi:carbon storage regulator